MFVTVPQTSDLADGYMVAVTVGDTEILLARVQGQCYAISNVCSHAEAWLDQGDLCPATWEV
jgi:nitrite reductase/ring-hydroxylating ferredoxin subunit